MAVALSLLVILPALAENSVKTDGQKALGDVRADRVAVGVFSNALDAQYDWQAFTPSDSTAGNPKTLVFNRDAQSLALEGDSPLLLATFAAGEIAYLLDDIDTEATSAALHPADPRNTWFDRTLYVSNDPGAYNTVLINAQKQWDLAKSANDENVVESDTTTANSTSVYCVMATVKNLRTNVSIRVPLVNAEPGMIPNAVEGQEFL